MWENEVSGRTCENGGSGRTLENGESGRTGGPRAEFDKNLTISLAMGKKRW